MDGVPEQVVARYAFALVTATHDMLPKNDHRNSTCTWLRTRTRWAEELKSQEYTKNLSTNILNTGALSYQRMLHSKAPVQINTELFVLPGANKHFILVFPQSLELRPSAYPWNPAFFTIKQPKFLYSEDPQLAPAMLVIFNWDFKSESFCSHITHICCLFVAKLSFIIILLFCTEI